MQNINNFSDCPQLLKDFLFYIHTIKGRSARTVHAYYTDLKLFFRYLKCVKQDNKLLEDLDSVLISDLTTEFICSINISDVYGFLNYVQTHNSNNAATRSRKVSSIRGLYNYISTKTSLLEENPVKNLEVPSVKKAMPRYLTLEESIELLQAVDGPHYARDYCIITFLLNCGMRLSELVAINIHDIRDNTVKLLGKGNKERIIYLNDACMESLSAYLKVRDNPVKQENKNVLFLSSRGTRLSPRRVQQIVEENLQRAGLAGKGYSPHKLRHTAATLMYQHGGVDIRVLKEILGHANLGTTEIYTHVSDKQLEKAADLSPLSKIKKTRTKK